MNPMNATDSRLDSAPGTYALLIGLEAPAELQVGRLGRISLDSPYYLYFGSAFGPGGLGARINRHLQPITRAHWHIDYLRQVADIRCVWYTSDTARLECTWANLASGFRGALAVPGFGSSDCDCQSHLLALERPPTLPGFRRLMNRDRPDSIDNRPIDQLLLNSRGSG